MENKTPIVPITPAAEVLRMTNEVNQLWHDRRLPEMLHEWLPGLHQRVLSAAEYGAYSVSHPLPDDLANDRVTSREFAALAKKVLISQGYRVTAKCDRATGVCPEAFRVSWGEPAKSKSKKNSVVAK